MNQPSTNPPYYRVKRGRAFFEPGSRRAAEAGWFRPDGKPKTSTPLGQAGEAAELEAVRLYHQLQRDRGAVVPAADTSPSNIVPGSFGHFFLEWRKSYVWSEMKPRTREDYIRCWPTIEERFGRTPIKEITVSASEKFHLEIKKLERDGELSASKRYRILKVWQALLNQAEKRDLFSKAPIGGIKNPQPKGCSKYWFADEIEKLSETAEREGYPGLSLAIRIAWETLLSPCDVRDLSLSRLNALTDGDGYFDTTRKKTGKDALPYVSRDLVRDIQSYLTRFEFEIGPDQPLLRKRDGTPYSTKDMLAREFRKVRNIAFAGDTRTFKDIRRSGNLEADLGGATPQERAELLANRLDKNAFLEATYTPATVLHGKQIRKKREVGRNLLKAEKDGKSRNTDQNQSRNESEQTAPKSLSIWF